MRSAVGCSPVVGTLEPEKRHLILLAYHYGMTREEIARQTGRPVATVKTWLRRSLAELRERLDQ